MKIERENNKITAYPSGRIDSSNAQVFLEELKAAIGAPEGQIIEINSENIEYISSAGLRSFLQLKKEYKNVKIMEVSTALYEIFSLTGFTEILDVEKALRRISVDGCRVIGRGFYGTVYRIDADTIVKVYETPDAVSMIKNEQLRARQAFLKGIPTAISFDLVRVDGKYGSVFELLDAKTFNDLVIEEPERIDEILKIYADFLKKVHSTEMDHDSLPYAADIYLEHLEVIRKHLTDEHYSILKKYLSEIPSNDHFVHGDIQMKNVMMVNGEPMLIDMDTLSAGYSIFDLAAIYVTYRSFTEDDPDNAMNFLGISTECAEYIWKNLMSLYFNDKTEAEITDIENMIKLLATIRFLHIIEISDLKNDQFAEIRIKRSREHIQELLEKVDRLYF